LRFVGFRELSLPSGVGKDPILCELSGLSLSSVDPNAARVGYKAAALLRLMIQGRKTIPKTTLIAPRGIVVRQSTNTLAPPNQEMANNRFRAVVRRYA
jgi:LacI family transcriptional regulator